MTDKFDVVGHRERKLDARALATGQPVFVADRSLPDTLTMKLLLSPLAHARITRIDTAAAEALPGVVCVLTHENTPSMRYTTAGQGYPEPSCYDTRMFDTKVRFVGDRVAAVAAETKQIAEEAISLIAVDYEELEPVLTIDDALAPGAPIVHDEDDALDIFDASRNIVARTAADVGDIERGFAECDVVVETTCETQYTQHAPLEMHTCLSYLDHDGRLVLYSSTQVPFHVRRIVARLLDLPVSRVRVIKPRIGGGFGAKQEVLIEDVTGLATLRTRRPVFLELTRPEEIYASRTRHPYRVRVKLGALADGTVHAIDLEALANSGAYGTHGLTVLSNAGSKTLPLYGRVPHVRFRGTVVYTNLPVGGAYRGYGGSQACFPLETAIDEAAELLSMDPVDVRAKNHIRAGETSPIFEQLGEGRPGVPMTISSCGLGECIAIGADRIGWGTKRGRRHRDGPRVHGVGMSIHMQGSGIPLVDMGAATLKMNDDGSFNLLVGATDIGTGSDTILGQIAAEVLGVTLDDIVVYSSDTDLTPFDVGAYASSTTYVSGSAVERAARAVRAQILDVAGDLLKADAAALTLGAGRVSGPDGGGIGLGEVAMHSLYGADQRQIAATASFVPELSPPPFLASFAEVTVDLETGEVRLVDYVAAVDCGTAVNPTLAEGQVEGAVVQGIGYALTEQFQIDDGGRVRNTDLARFKIPTTLDVPPLHVILVDSYDPTGPMGAKSIAEIGINGPIPTIANAIYDAVGVRLRKTPFTAERVFAALTAAGVAEGVPAR